jgi:hypothetical protein
MKTHISTANAKLEELHNNETLPIELTGLATWSLPAGYSCPEALDCMAKAVVASGKATLVDGKYTKFRCFEATMEAQYSALRENSWENFELLRDCKNDVAAMVTVLESAIAQTSRKVNLFRIHVGGDFFSANYLRAWYIVAANHPDIFFYAYSKSVRHMLATGYHEGAAPSNLNIVASYGGRSDALIKEYNLQSAVVVYSEAEAEALGLEIDHDDSHAAFSKTDFALLIHGTQPKGSIAGEALKVINRAKREAKAAA